VDLFPTLLAVANSAQPPQELHGMDLTPLFRSPGQGLAERNLYWYLPGYSAFHEPSVMVRRGQWKLIRSLETEAFQLFDTLTDIGETNDLGGDHPEIASDLDSAAMRWLDDLNAPRMIPNPEFKP
jgi:arylsulfatase A-like enzyme